MIVERPIQDIPKTPGRVTMLTFLSRHFPAARLGETVAQSLHTETGATVALLRLFSGGTPLPTVTGPSAGLSLDGNGRLPALAGPTDAGFYFLNLAVSDGAQPP